MIRGGPMSREGVIGQRQPAYDIDQSVSLVSLNINYYCLLDTFQQPPRKYYVHVRRDKHDNPGMSEHSGPVPPRLSCFACYKNATAESVFDTLLSLPLSHSFSLFLYFSLLAPPPSLCLTLFLSLSLDVTDRRYLCR